MECTAKISHKKQTKEWFRMSRIIQPEYIKLNTNDSSQEEVFQTIASIAVENGIASSVNDVVKGLKAREEESTTGFQEGFAIPHTQSDAVIKPAVVIVRTKNGIEWQSFDDKPSFFFLSLLIPNEEAGSTHLQALSALSRALMDEDKRQAFLDATTGEELAELIGEAIPSGEDH